MTERTCKQIAVWLTICAVLVFSMVLFGGAVRLTGSGLSMVDWKPLMGIFPPISHQDWQAAFDQYKQFPEYKLVNSNVDLSYFKFIYLMEYGHRVLGRVIGLVFFIPMVYFTIMGNLPRTLKIRLFGLFTLGGIQGGLGWYMVQSGLVDNPAVSQYRLTLHLLVAVLIYGYLIRCIAGLLRTHQYQYISNNQRLGVFSIAMVFLMIGSGGLMAGTHAGFIFNTFPAMGGSWIPDQLFSMRPFWLNLFENPVTIQFFHRALALFITILILLLAVKLIRSSNGRSWFISVSLVFFLMLQVSLGISTLVLGVPVELGVAHQGGALILFGYLCLIFATPYQFLSR